MKTLQRYLQEFADDDGDVECRSYSGRFMYGRSCVALTGSSERVFALLGELLAEFLDDLYHKGTAHEDVLLPAFKQYARILMDFRQDQMGLGTVIYWPQLNWEEDQSDAPEVADE